MLEYIKIPSSIQRALLIYSYQGGYWFFSGVISKCKGYSGDIL
jgi:hypothetical protein